LQRVSFLDLQDLALAIAQSGIGALVSAWGPDFDDLLNALEAGAGACLITLVVQQRTTMHREKP
jgi:hypothetical protein